MLIRLLSMAGVEFGRRAILGPLANVNLALNDTKTPRMRTFFSFSVVSARNGLFVLNSRSNSSREVRLVFCTRTMGTGLAGTNL